MRDDRNHTPPLHVFRSIRTAKVSGMNRAEYARVSADRPSLIHASLGFTLSLVTLVGCAVGLGMIA